MWKFSFFLKVLEDLLILKSLSRKSNGVGVGIGSVSPEEWAHPEPRWAKETEAQVIRY